MAGIEDVIEGSGCTLESKGSSHSCFGPTAGVNHYFQLKGTKEQLTAALESIHAVTPMRYAEDFMADLLLNGSFKVVHCKYEGLNYYPGILPVQDGITQNGR